MTIFARLLIMGLLAAPLFAVGANAAPPQPTPPTPQSRTYVSGTGSDSNACTASSPCKTFSAALALTTAGGEIYALNSSNYGPVTINKAVTINGEGAAAGVLATSGTGITINAGAADIVTLRGLDIDGAKTGSIGIQFNSGRSLNLQKSTVRNFANVGINFAGAGTLTVSDTLVLNNAGKGLAIASGSGSVVRVTASGNGVGILASGATANVAVTDSVANNNNYGIAASAAALMVRNSAISSNAVGIVADQAAMVRVGQSTVTANGAGWQATNAGQILSFGNNNLSGNTTDGIATTTVALQ